jgi:pyruvate kinase
MDNFTKTKIVATIGPSSSSYEMLEKMSREGMNVARLNFSHGSYQEHQQVIDNIRLLNKNTGSRIGILADLQGPKIRTGVVENEPLLLKEGTVFTLTTEETTCKDTTIHIKYEFFARDVKPGEHVLIDDGKIVLRILETDGEKTAKAEVVSGGNLLSKKGVNLPNTKVSIPSLTPKDLADLDFLLEQEVEWIGLSFVRSAADIIELRHRIRKSGKRSRIVAKIEKPEALEDIDEIITESDAIMVARGDLGVEMPMEQVPIIQKMIVNKCLSIGRPSIIATQMMESMIENISPTRAEVNDAANSILDGADAVMLSAETSTGKHPDRVINAVKRIIAYVEAQEIYDFPINLNRKEQPDKERFISNEICRTACRVANETNAVALVANTHSGYSAIKLSSYRPKANIYAFTGNEFILNALSLVWGVRCVYYDKFVSTDHTIADIKYLLKKQGFAQPGDIIVNIASIPLEEKGMSNMLKISVI